MKKKIFILTILIITNIFCASFLMFEFQEKHFNNSSITKENNFNQEFSSSNLTDSLDINVYNLKVKNDIDYLNLSQEPIDGNLINVLDQFPNLKKVILTNKDMSIKDQIALVKKYPQIEFKFTIKFEDKVYSSDAKELDLSYTAKSLEEIKDFLLLFPKLKKLDLSYSSLSNEECNEIRNLYPNVTTNWVVHMGKWNIKTDAITFSLLIKVIDHKNKLTSKDIEVLKYCTNLKALDLGHQAITDISMIGDYLPELRVLILADNKITDLSPLKKLKKLHYLELFLNPVSDISPLKENKELVDLNLANLNNLTDVTPLMDLPKLERLWINNTGVTSENLQTLKNAYPNVLMVTTGTLSTHGSWRYHPRYTQLVDMFNNNYYGNEFSKYD